MPKRVIFSAAVRTDVGTYPTLYTLDTGSYAGVKRPGRGVDHSTTSSADVIE